MGNTTGGNKGTGSVNAHTLWIDGVRIGFGGGNLADVTGSPIAGNLTVFSGPTSITSGNLSGDVTTLGTLVATVANLSHVTNASLPNSGLVNSTMTVNGTLCTLGSSCNPTFSVSGTSGGIPYFDSATSLASSGVLTVNRLVLGGGAGAAPTVLGSLGTTTTLLHGNAAGAPTFAAASLTADVSGILPVANGGTGLALGTSGGILAYTSTGTITSTAILAASRIVVGGGAGSAPHTVTTGGSTTQVLHGAVGDPTWSQVNLATDVTGGPLPSGSTGIEMDLFYSGVPPNNAFLLKSFSRVTTVAASAPIKCAAKVGATASATVLLYKVVSGTPTGIGTLVFGASGSAYQGCTVTFSGAISFAAGDVLEADFPASADATLANIAISIPAIQ